MDRVYELYLGYLRGRSPILHMGVGLTKRKSLTITDKSISRINPVLFGKMEAEMALKDCFVGTYLMYRDYETDHLYLSIRTEDSLRHHSITQRDGLYFLDKQPYAYLDSIILYHKKHKLRGIKLTRQAPLSARVVKSFASRFAANNGNLPETKNLQGKTKKLEEALSRL